MKTSFDFLKSFLPLAAAVTFVCGLIYLATQQSLRRGADDPQIQMAEDAAAVLAAGQTPGPLRDTSEKIDLARSLAPGLVSYDDSVQPLAATAQLNGKIPTPPHGVFDYARNGGQHRVTWQPERGVRLASVIVHYNGVKSGFVLACRSLRETEDRVSDIGRLIGAGWVFTIVALLAGTLALRFIEARWVRTK